MEKDKLKILILVLSINDGTLYSEFYKTQKETWDSIHIEGITTFYYYGNSKENLIISDKIFLNEDEGLPNCGRKTISCFNIIRNLDFDYIFRTNSSSYIDKKMLRDHLYNKPRENFYSGVIGDHDGIKFASGSGYVLSKDLVNIVLEQSLNWDHSVLDDVSLGILLKHQNIYPESADRFEIITKNTFHNIFYKIPLNYFHYRLKSKNRNLDIWQMKNIFKFKKK